VPYARLVPPVLVALALTATAPADARAQMPEGPLPGLGGEPPRVEPARPPDGGDRSDPRDGGDRSERAGDEGAFGQVQHSSTPTEPVQEGAPTQEGQLPNTGSEPALLALCGASLLLAGTGLRLRTSDVPVG